MDMDEFLNPKARYYGSPCSKEVEEFNEALQEFQNKVAIIVGLETNGKLTPHEAYKKIKALWKELKSSKKHLIEKEATE